MASASSPFMIWRWYIFSSIVPGRAKTGQVIGANAVFQLHDAQADVWEHCTHMLRYFLSPYISV